MAGLPGLGTVYYNGFLFPGAVVTGLRARPELDTTQRFTKWTEYEVVIEFIAHAGVDDELNQIDPSTNQPYQPKVPANQSLDASMVTLRRLLTQSGQPFVFRNKGAGLDLGINIGTGFSRQDLAYGPHPQILVWEPVGSNQAVRIVWSISFRISDCSKLQFENLSVTEFLYTVTHSIDASGLTTRTISGHVEVFNSAITTRAGTRVNGQLDLLRRRLTFPVPVGMQRVSQSWPLNAARNRLGFTVVDREHPSDNALPHGVVDINVRHRVSNTTAVLFVKSQMWKASLRGTISVSKSTPRWRCWTAFADIVSSRRAALGEYIIEEENEEQPPLANVITRKLDIEEDIYGRSMTFSVEWEVYKVPLNGVFLANGIWKEVSRNWRGYGESMKEPWGPTGSSGLLHDARQDLIVSICDEQSQRLLFPSRNPLLQRHGIKENRLTSSCRVDPYNSYIIWEHEAIQHDGLNTIEHTILGGSEVIKTTSFKEQNTGGAYVASQSGARRNEITQMRTNSNMRILYKGYAKRLGYPIPNIHLLEYGGLATKPIAHPAPLQENSQLPNTLDGCTVYEASWQRYYSIDGIPKGNAITTDPDRSEHRIGRID